MIKYFFAVLSLYILGGCSSSENDDPQFSFSVGPPERTALALESANLSVKVTVDGQPYSLERGINGSPWVGNFALPTDRSLPLLVEWSHGSLLIARYVATLDPITESVRLEVSSDQYTTTGIEFDADNDGTSNLAELEAGSNPTSAQNIDFVIPKLVPPDTIGVNGSSGPVWPNYITNDWTGDLPRINNLMIDRNALREDGTAEFYWQAVHDGVSLFIIVYGESSDISTPIRDSRVVTRDDAVHLFFDGDNSKLNSYDGINDLFITIPLIAQRVPADESIQLQPVIAEDGDYIFDDRRYIAFGNPAAPTFLEPAGKKPNSDELPNTDWVVGPQGQVPNVNFDGFKFANAIVSQGSQVYEIQIPLANFGIQVGRPFGFEVQIDSDHNGGNSDARYGWRHPSRGINGPDVNFTVRDPSYMGTAVLAE